MTVATEPLAGAGAWIKALVDGWAGYSEDEEKLTRVFLSPQHKACTQAVMPPGDLRSSSVRRITTRSCRGRSFM